MAKQKEKPENTSEENNENIPTRKKVLEKKSFNLGDYKKKNNNNVKHKNKPERWLPVSKAFQESLGLQGGLCLTQSHVVTGYENTGKSTYMLECAVSCQKNNVLPIFFITEQKHRWGHAISMGFEIEEIVDEEDGSISYDGFFMYYDRNDFNTVEEMAKIMHKLMDDQESEKLPYDICFFVDSFGKLNCDKGVKNGNQFNPQWVATAVAHEFGASIIPRVNMTISESKPYTATLFSIVQPWTELPQTYGELPKLTPKAGKSLPQDSAIVIKFGKDTNSGISKLKIKKQGKDIIYGTRTRVSLVKNHLNDLSLDTKLVIVKEGFILEEEAKDYIKDNADYFLSKIEANSIDDGVEFLDEENE
jgi:hypothetical protein